MSFFRRFYDVAFSRKYLFYTNVTISFCLSGIGDLVDQSYEKFKGKRAAYDFRRTLTMSVAGLSSGFVCHHWYIFLDKRLPAVDVKTAMIKIVLDETICSPIYLSAFFVTLGYMEGRTLAESFEQLKKKIWRIYRFEWMLWPPAQFINFYFLPTHMRVLYVYLISIIYMTYTAHVTHDEN